MKNAFDAFEQSLSVGDIVVYAVGQGHAAGGLRFGRVKNTEKPVFTSFEPYGHWVFDEPVGYDHDGTRNDVDGWLANVPPDPDHPWKDRISRKKHWETDGYKEERARRIGGFKQVMKVADLDTILTGKPDLLKFIRSL